MLFTPLRILAHLCRWLVALAGDLLFDTGATKRAELFSPREVSVALVAPLSGAVAWIDLPRKIVQQFLGITSNFLPLALLIFGFLWCILVIVAKDLPVARPAGFTSLRDGPPVPTYRNTQVTRWLAKLMLLLLLVPIPRAALAWADTTFAMPPKIYGYILDAQSGQPIEGARLRVINENGIDVTSGEWLSDSTGFYVVETSARVTRLASLEVYRRDCQVPQSLSLKREFEVVLKPLQDEHLRPMFRHQLGCIFPARPS